MSTKSNESSNKTTLFYCQNSFQIHFSNEEQSKQFFSYFFSRNLKSTENQLSIVL